MFSATTLCLVLNAVLVNFIQPCRSPNSQQNGRTIAMSMLALYYVSLPAQLTTFYLDIYWYTPSNISFRLSIVVTVFFFIIVLAWTLLRNKLKKLFKKLQYCLRKKEKDEHAVEEREDFLQIFSERSAII